MRTGYFYSIQGKLRIIFISVLILIVAASMFYTNRLVTKLSEEEQHRMELLAAATKFVIEAEEHQDISFAMQVIQMNTTIPVVIIDADHNLIDHRNIRIRGNDEEEFFRKRIQSMKSRSTYIPIEFESGANQYIGYDYSLLMRELTYFPVIQLIILILFSLTVLYVILSTKKAEQNKVWVGLSKETAHQLGTPISSLLAWLEILKTQNVDSATINEMSNDVERLSVIADRFSKIGSKPNLETHDLSKVLNDSIDYMRNRTSHKVHFDYQAPKEEIILALNVPLFEWVVENLCKNAVDAMDGKGKIKIEVKKQSDSVTIDISDTGKGMTKSEINKIFDPGHTTKARGWGLGLPLVKRIVEEYHNGKIYVKNSELNKGTTFRIVFSQKRQS